MQRKAVALLAILALSFVALSVNIQFGHCVVTWTYNAGTNTATASGAGSTNFAALVAADTAGGWGKFTADATGTQIICAGKIIVGDATNACAFSDTKKQVLMLAGVIAAANERFIYVRNSSSMTLGTVVNAGDKASKNGVSFTELRGGTYANFALIYTESATAVVNCYSCSFYGTGGSHEVQISGATFWNCLFNEWTEIDANRGPDVFNCIANSAYYTIKRPSGGTYDKFTSLYPNRYLYFQNGGGTVSNFYGRGASNVAVRCESVTTSDMYLINPDFDIWTFNWSGSTKTCYRQYQFDLCVLNGEITDFVENANVTLTKNGVQIGTWLTNSSGQIDTQTLTYGYYNSANGNTLQEGNYPFVLTVTHPDWATYTSRFYVTEKTRMTISLQEIDTATPNNAAMVWGLLALAGAFCFLILWRVRR